MKKRLLFVALVIFAGFVGGCLTSQEPFYRGADIIWDSRILGDYRDPKTQEGLLIQRDPDHKGRYMVRTFDGPHGDLWIMFVGTLFKAGEKTFLDLSPIRDTGGDHQGGMPGSNEILHGLVYQPLHLVVQVSVTDEGVGFSAPHTPDQIRAVIRNDPSLAQYYKEKGRCFRFTQATPELHALLEKLSVTDDVFPKPEKYQRPIPSKVSGLQE